MKNIWKWLLGIVLALVVLAGLVGAAFAVRNVMAAHMAIRQVRVVQGGTPNPQDGVSPKDGPMQHGFPGWHEPGRGFGFSPFHGRTPFRPGFMLLGGLMRLVPLVLLGLLVAGAYLLGKRARIPLAAAAAPAATHACLKCGQPVLDDSKYCPSCGEKQ